MYRVTITNGRGMIRETVSRIYRAADEAEARRMIYTTHPYSYGWRVKRIEKL